MPTNFVIPWTTRSDLSTIDMGGTQGNNFAIKDKITNEFFRFGELELHILDSLKSTVTLEGLQASIKSKFGVTVSGNEVMSYLHHLASDNLLVARRLGDGERLFRQHSRLASSGRLQRLLGLLSIKLPGFYPGALLNLLQPIGRLVFNPISVMALSLVIFATMIYALMSFQTVWYKAPALAELLSVEHLLWMTIGFIIIKMVHELGHGLACRQMGHECSEMGVLLLVMIPCLYCDVSDMWTAKSRYKRILVSLAGVFVELIFATVCFWGWYYSLDGPLHRFLFGMMIVASANTLFVNGNPLMRYDGYYALSDWVRVPNLAAVSQASLSQWFDGFFLNKEPVLTLHQRSGWLRLFAAASVVYRWFIMFAIGWAAWSFFENQQLLSMGRFTIGALLVLTAIPILLGVQRYFNAAWRHGFRLMNTLVFLGLLVVIGFGICQIHFPHRITGEAKLHLANPRHVFAPAAGQILPKCEDGQWIQGGAPIALISNDEMTLEALLAQQQIDDAGARLSALKISDQTQIIAAQTEFWKQRKQSWDRKLDDIRGRQAELLITSPLEGQFVAEPYPPIDQEAADQSLKVKKGNWAAKSHAGNFVSRGMNLGYVASPETFEGNMRVSEQDIELVEIGQEVRVFVPFDRDYVAANVSRISAVNQSESQNFPVDQDQDQGSTFYNVKFQFPADHRVRIGAVRKAVILCQQTTVFDWVTRWLYHSFWF